ncbi:hypothetical protein Tco_1054309 [Tanacetum coccineum]|uniref:Uncharacterized protein n=1 Tax=Tanacetum coccineum TaxID=301880 RepID=A0ABQ5GWE5_9ASTR
MRIRLNYQYDSIQFTEYGAEEEKARRRGETFNWQTATYGRREYYDDEDNSFTNFETEFPAIVFDDITTNTALSCESKVSPLNDDEIDFKISFDESDDEDYTNEFPAIVYNDALTSKLDLLTEPTISPQHIDEFDLKDETSLSEFCLPEHYNGVSNPIDTTYA